MSIKTILVPADGSNGDYGIFETALAAASPLAASITSSSTPARRQPTCCPLRHRSRHGTSFFYAHSDQWRYEKIDVRELLSPLADPASYRGSIIDLNVRAERMGWLPAAPQFDTNPLKLAVEAERVGADIKNHVAGGAERRPHPDGL